jgi:hypothetical protein
MSYAILAGGSPTTAPALAEGRVPAAPLDASIQTADVRLASQLARLDRFADGPFPIHDGLRTQLRQRSITNWVVSVGASIAGPIAGYAMEDGVPMLKAGANGTAPAAKGARDSSTSASKGHSQWDFMSDPKVSIEDKLFRFMALIQKKNDAELTKKMNEFRDKYTKEGTGKKDGGGGIFGFIGNALGSLVGGLKAAFPPLALAEKLLGATGLQKLVAQILPWRSRRGRRSARRSGGRRPRPRGAPRRRRGRRRRKGERPTRSWRCWNCSGWWRSRTRPSTSSPTSSRTCTTPA